MTIMYKSKNTELHDPSRLYGIQRTPVIVEFEVVGEGQFASWKVFINDWRGRRFLSVLYDSYGEALTAAVNETMGQQAGEPSFIGDAVILGWPDEATETETPVESRPLTTTRKHMEQHGRAHLERIIEYHIGRDDWRTYHELATN